jgi:hypothetical protein
MDSVGLTRPVHFQSRETLRLPLHPGAEPATF